MFFTFFRGVEWLKYIMKYRSNTLIKSNLIVLLCISILGRDRDKDGTFHVYRLKQRQWNKISERKWKWRSGNSCELLDEDTMVVIGGYGYGKSVDILNLISLSWSKVRFKLNQS